MFVVVFALSFASCKKKGDKVAKKEFGEKVSVLMDEAAEKVVNAEDAAAVAAALNEFLDAKKQIVAEKKAKCKDGKEGKEGKDCAVKKDKDCKFKEKCDDFNEKISAQLEKYKDDPEVAKAVQRLTDCKSAKAKCVKEGKAECDKEKK